MKGREGRRGRGSVGKEKVREWEKGMKERERK